MDKEKLIHITKEQVASALQASFTGLTGAGAAKRLELHGPNTLKNERRHSALLLFLGQFKSSLIYLLIIASALSFALNDINDGIVIAVILAMNTGLGFYQASKSEKAVEKLQKLVSRQILVMRDGKEQLLPEKCLVPGDLVVLRAGDIAPADIRLFEVNDLTVNESQLTGEVVPIAKQNSGSASLVYAGSTIEQGEARGFVYATGATTELGKIAHLTSATKRVTQFEKSLASFSAFLIKVIFLTLAAVFLLKLFLMHDTSHIGTLALFIIALSIAVVPEAMPVIITVTLSRGALKLAKQHVIAKTLTAVEDLGDIDVLCSDKTGTLTENKLTIKKQVADDAELFQRLAIISLETLNEKQKRFQSSFDRAFLAYVPAAIQQAAKSYRRLEELPFDPNARRRRAVCSDGHTTYLIEVGSAETLLELTNDTRKQEYLSIIQADGAKGLRHLGIAYKEIAYHEGYDILKNEQQLRFAGFVALEDQLRPSAKHTIALAEKLGLGIKILSGDSKEVTHYVAAEVGLLDKDQTVYTGDDIDRMSDEQLAEVVARQHAFARLHPEQKYRIIQLLKLQGNVVGYQGDGINDAPALKLADVAIAVSNATDIAQESADILLLGSGLGVIVSGIESGRAIFSNINKYIRFTFVSNWGSFFALSTLYLMSMDSLPILPVQVLLTSLLTDLPCITIATDNVATSELMRPSKFNVQSIMFISMFLGVVTAVFEIMYYDIIKSYVTGVAETGLYLFLTFTALIVIFSIRNKDHFWRAPKLSAPMKIAFVAIAALAIALVYFPFTQKLLSFTALSPNLLGITLLMTLAYFVVMDTIKVWFYKTTKA